ncbi:hypothetical protein ACI2I2_16080 [Scandinavium sp. NPDC088450]|uniref:hypothetical protein n=1 Tax=Scandinavium sp. NPDC088450 TaxID=3364514 RepID=UPI00384B0105
MQASDYLKLKFQSDRQLAIYGQQGVTSTWKALQGIGSDLYSGVERASWYSSCLLPKYQDVCQELLSEEKRMWMNIYSIYRYRDVIGQMLHLYFEMVVEDTRNGNNKGDVRSVDTKATKFIAGIATSRVARSGVTLAFAEALSSSNPVAQAVVERLAARVPNVVTAFQLFGTEQHCAMAARRLKALDPKYYAILYNAQLEMLYYFVEPILSDVIKKVQMKVYRDFDEIYDALKSKYNV